jgi:hypothetical protein
VAYTATAPRAEPNATLSAFVTDDDGDDTDPDDDTERRDDASPDVREEDAE